MDPELLNQIPDSIRPRVEAAFLHLQIQNRFLSEALRMERIRKFGPSSERLTTDQVELLTLEPVVTAQEVPAEVARRRWVAAAWAKPGPQRRGASKAVGAAGGDAGCGAAGGEARSARSQQHHGPRG